MKKLWHVLFLTVLFFVLLVAGSGNFEALASVPWDDSLYIAQTEGTCTLASAIMMLRARTFLCNNPQWQRMHMNDEGDEAGVYHQIWINDGTGLKDTFTYTIPDGDGWISVKYSDKQGISLAEVKNLLNEKEEGFVLYCKAIPHAIFITDYEGDTVYCSDPSTSAHRVRIPLDQSVLVSGGYYQNQADILQHTTKIWYVTDYNIPSSVTGSAMTCGYSQMLPDGDYVIMSAAATDKSKVMYLDISGADFPASNDTNVILYECSTDTPVSQDIWTIKYSDGFYSIKQKGAEIALDVWYESLYSGASIRAGTAHGKANQQWAISRNGSNGYRVQSKISGFAMDIAGGSARSGANILQRPVDNSPSQSWLFIPYNPSPSVAEGHYILVNGDNPAYELNVPGGSAAADQTAVNLWKNSTPNQNNAFELIKLPNGYYTFKHSASEKVLEIYGGVSTYPCTASVFTGNGSIAQQWAIIPQGSDTYRIVSKCNGYVLSTDASSSLTNGTGVYANPIYGNENQTWRFVKAGYTLHYIGGTGDPEDQYSATPQMITLSTSVPIRSGYVFKGWSDSIDATIPIYQPGDEFYLCQNTTLYAVWENSRPGVHVSCAVNGVAVPAGTIVGSFDLTVFGMNNYEETWSGKSYWYVDTVRCDRYSITNVNAAPGYRYDTVITGSLSGPIGESYVYVVLNFVPIESVTAELQVLLEVDGEPVETLEGIGSFDVRVTGTEVSVNEQQCTSFSGQYSEICDYEITNITAIYPYTCPDGSLRGTLNDGITVILLSFNRMFVPQEDWQEMDTLPDSLDMDICDVEYKNHYTYSGRTSPGEGWTLLAEGPVQYENTGGTYQSDEELPVSESRVLVSRFYYHYCGSEKNNANWFQKSYLPTYHTIPAADFGKFSIAESGPDADPERGTRTYYLLRWNTGENSGNLAYCPSIVNNCGSACWYIMYVYQDRTSYQINTYGRDSGWSAEPDPDASSVTYRVRLRANLTVTFDNNGGLFDIQTLRGYAGQPVDLPMYGPEKPGYSFFNWTPNKDGTESGYLPGGQITCDEDTTLYAQWRTLLPMVLPEDLQEIEDEAFVSVRAEYIRIPDSCTFIGKKAFSGMSFLQQVYIPESVTHIENDAFNSSGIIGQFTVFGFTGSAAETFAKDKGYVFVDLNDYE